MRLPRPRSMAGRLTLSLAAGLVAMWLVAVATAAVWVQQELTEVFDSILQESAQRILADILERDRPELEAVRPGDSPLVTAAVPHEEYITYQLFSASGQLLLRSHAAGTASLATGPSPGFSNITGTRSYTEQSVDGRYRLMIAEPPDHRGHAIRGALYKLLAPLLGLVAAATLLIPWAVRLAFRPVARLKAEIGRRSGADLSPIADPGLPEELLPMRDDVNLLLRRLRHGLEAERNFSANAAHELRTPIAAALARAQLLTLRLPPGKPERQDAEAMVDGLRALARRIEKLLQLARAEAGVALSLRPVDLVLAIHLVVDELTTHAEATTRLRVDDGGLDVLMVAGDLDALAIALRNLVENALLHGDPAHPVEVGVTADGIVRVTNGGPIVPPDQLATIEQPFVSHDGKGSGLGLSIVKVIADQVGGKLALRSPVPGRAGGFEAVLSLKLADPRAGAPPRDQADVAA